MATPKQLRRRGRWSLVLGTVIAALMVVAVAMGDNLKNDVVAGGNDTFAAGGSTSIDYWIQATGGTCDAADGSSATVTINVPAGVTATPPSLVFTQCNTSGNEANPNNTQAVTFSSATPGNYSITATVADTSGTYNPAPAAFTLLVTAAENSAPSVEAGGPYSGAEGSSVSLDGTVTDPDAGDTVTTSWTYAVDSADPGTTCSFGNAAAVDTTVTCTDDGTFTLTLTANDGVNPAVSSTASLTLSNANPAITSASFTCPTDPVPVDTAVNLGGSFTDAGANDTHTASIAWGDGNSAAATVTQGAGSGSVTGSHTYTAAGIYTPSLTVTDDDGGADTESCEYVVVYDPSAGFVTGGGWINSPAGAYLADPTMVGKATFGFVSKYKKGADVPDGSTEFQFHAAGLSFKSTSYQWLVVSGSKATFKGWGTINGQGNYGFLLSAMDGSPDTFRIKIWEVGGDVVYDNNLGGGDDADPATALGGGSIVIHTGKK